MRSLSIDEQGRMLAAMDRLRDRLLFLTGLYTGFRISEMLSLRVGDVWRGGAPVTVLTVARRNLKGGAGENARRVRSRSVAVGDELRAAISTYIGERFPTSDPAAEEFVFKSREGGNRAITLGQAWRILKRAGEDAGAVDRVGTHSMRKTFAWSIYKNSGHDLVLTKAAIGHSSITTTGKYLEASEPAVVSAVLGIKGPGLRLVAPVAAATAPRIAVA